MEAAVRAQGATLDVAGQVQRDAAAVGVGRVELDVPVGAPLLGDGGAPVGGGLLRGQSQALVVQRL